MKIIKNYITKEELNTIKQTLESPAFPWYCNHDITESKTLDLKNFQFTHSFFMNYMIASSAYFNILTPILKKLKPHALIRIKANLRPYTEQPHQTEWHIDNEVPNAKTAIFYVNTNNGCTLFKDKKRILSEENKIIIFDSKIKHCGVTSTNTKYRIVLNFNYV
jgi:hypothetical protein